MSQMDDFWKIAWIEGRTRFHQPQFNPDLTEYLRPQLNRNCLVPLCGKSLDLIYLADHFEKVVGVEMVEQPIIEFYQENEIPYERNGNHFSSHKIDIYLADFIQDQLSDDTGPLQFDYIYDRASMVAIEDTFRQNYVQKIKHYLQPEGVLHLVTFEREILGGGPPFDITDSEVQKSYGDHKIELLSEIKRGLTTSQGDDLQVYRRIYHIRNK